MEAFFVKNIYLCTVNGDPQGVIRAMSGTLATAFVGIICTKVARDSVDGSLFCEKYLSLQRRKWKPLHVTVGLHRHSDQHLWRKRPI